MLTALDLAARKVLAIVERLEARDYTDLHALALLLGRQACIDAALSMDIGLRTNHVANAFARVTALLDHRFPPTAQNAHSVKNYFTDWTDDLRTT